MNQQSFARILRTLLGVAGCLVFVFGIMAAPSIAKKNGDRVYTFNDKGELLQPLDWDVPSNWREEWIYVGTPLTPNELNNGKAAFPEFHSVYIHPDHYKVYKKTGAFPDGTILIKEMTSVGSKQAASGQGYFMGEYLGLEATIKDSKRFPNEPGYWAYFSWTDEEGGPRKKTTKAQPADKCNACHQAFAKDDWVFTQYYPVLRAAKPGMGK
jgi:hypothetical protein